MSHKQMRFQVTLDLKPFLSAHP